MSGLDARAAIDRRGARASDGLLADLAASFRALPDGELLALTVDADAVPDVEAWSRLTGHPIVARGDAPASGARLVVRKGAAPAGIAEREDGARLWIYANFDCNLSCDYCCVRSSPKAPRRAIGVPRARALAEEARSLGFSRILLTGGEPFLLPDIEDLVRACADALPTTLLTNAMLFRGARLAALERLPRDRVTLQVSLDSPDPALHDAHRGKGSWARAREGIATARALGFRVRIAATTRTEAERRAMDDFLAAEGVPPEDRVIRPLARRGESREGVALARSDLVPELTVTADGVYWHPVGATDDDFLVTRNEGPLASAVAEAKRLVTEDRAFAARVAEVFPCA